ncbi:hypothetical protein ABS755_14310 [Castellaniella sp. FW104-16D08]|uniref:hypothetical protein n=1 Tax=unclassified Castellaniella TaxID=2617606 RepID=UPI0033152E44
MISARALALFVALVSGSTLFVSPSLGATGTIAASQKEGVTLKVKNPNELVFSAAPGPEVDHLHVYVDGELVGQTRQLKGGFTLGNMDLSPGKHAVCIKVANRAHVSTGAEDCVNINVG